ncbi:unnamed protein product [Microthlaspi erraticum]|uniref:EF-hand domain-containing protein n=1 Tax=Microthlaspi erraticum TaxID=1685480 RepID=A0A6D2K5W4_9BRAS|nr:unnamed protein product [Microthlaspi erraticum]CAA7047314.1 unnamed protein product [Microthlaspi erraticum]
MASSGGESSSSGEEAKGKMSEYEKQRFSRIAENKARLEALGISSAAKALVGSRKLRGKRNSGEEDDDYRPGEADGDEDDEDDDEEEEIDDGEYDDEDEELLGNSTCKRKKKKSSASKRKVISPGMDEDEEEDDDDLKKAIALSLQDSVAGGSSSKRMRNDQEAATWKKKKPDLVSKMQMTEDELLIYFYQFDDAGKGFITLRDVAKLASLHDFTWTDEDLQDMIRCFDLDKDGKLSLDEFRKIVTRCRMLKES